VRAFERKYFSRQDFISDDMRHPVHAARYEAKRRMRHKRKV
jgi:hypothetical protein